MKRFLSTLAIGFAAWTFAGAGNAVAADFKSQCVAVPFAFKVDRMTLPAGEYRLEQTVGKQIAFLVNTQTGHRVPVLRESIGGPSGNAKLTFEKSAAGYRLSKVS